MKSFIIAFFTLASLVTATPAVAAPDIGLGKGGLANDIAKKGGYETSGVTDTTLSESIGKIIKVVLSLTGTIFFALTIYAGFLWMTASGNDEQVSKAKGILRMAIIGLVIALGSYGITVFVMNSIFASARNTTYVGQTGPAE